MPQRRVVGGDQVLVNADFADAVEAHLYDMYRFAVSLSSIDRAEDLVQEALARAWVKREQFDSSRGSPKTWLLAIVADRARQTGRRGLPEISSTFSSEGVAVSDISDTRLDIRSAVSRLPSRQRTAIVLHHYVDLPITEVAQLMKCSPGTVKSTLHDARKNLSGALGASYVRH